MSSMQVVIPMADLTTAQLQNCALYLCATSEAGTMTAEELELLEIITRELRQRQSRKILGLLATPQEVIEHETARLDS
jgi:hypothetical protein